MDVDPGIAIAVALVVVGSGAVIYWRLQGRDEPIVLMKFSTASPHSRRLYVQVILRNRSTEALYVHELHLLEPIADMHMDVGGAWFPGEPAQARPKARARQLAIGMCLDPRQWGGYPTDGVEFWIEDIPPETNRLCLEIKTSNGQGEKKTLRRWATFRREQLGCRT
jgi:hypothetical protein